MSRMMHCPYCDETVRTGRIRWKVLLMQAWPFYLLYCLLSSGRVRKLRTQDMRRRF